MKFLLPILALLLASLNFMTGVLQPYILKMREPDSPLQRLVEVVSQPRPHKIKQKHDAAKSSVERETARRAKYIMDDTDALMPPPNARLVIKEE